ncbi:MAG: asparagine synthase (glutamine-hydrolyzing) [Chlorobia bacterium]|nr:asparagine synthase (glutamine-hydrolyzing) [Fimbriimonadaceae bacterium]
MCGITGFFGPSPENAETILRSMTDAISHRGPDSEGQWIDPLAGIHLGFRRLSIIDLSESGNQPMISHSGRFVCVFNGEIYNFEELRSHLGSVDFRGHSDTEVLLEHIESFGLQDTLAATSGMFALAIWDRETRRLTLARDRIGEKPLYYGWSGDVLLFGSELKALRRFPTFAPEVDRNVLAQYLRFAYVPSPWSIYQGIYKLQAGSYLTLESPEKPLGFDPFKSPTQFWDLAQIANQPRESISEENAVEKLDKILKEVVETEMISDVPLGAFLSGGIDSSAVVAIMQAVSRTPAKSFTIGFHEQGFNEAEQAKLVAQHLGTDHTEHYVTSQDALDVLPLLPTLYDEPFADPSQIPTYLISKLARRDVTVCLSGDGGDELFGGYNRYFMAEKLWRRTENLPRPLRRSLGSVLVSVSPKFYDKMGRATRSSIRLLGDKAHKFAALLDVSSANEMYGRLVSQWREPLSVVLGACPERTTFDAGQTMFANLPFTERMMAIEGLTYLPDDIMVKVDRASMGVSLESRSPFLHHKVVEFAWSLPLESKVKGGQGKRVLRKVLDRYVPRQLIDRPKMGFAVPIDAWLRGPLRDWAEALLDPKRLEAEGFFKVEPIRKKWTEHIEGRRNWQYQLWCVLMFQAWLET